jgi:hypothetical protein
MECHNLDQFGGGMGTPKSSRGKKRRGEITRFRKEEEEVFHYTGMFFFVNLINN